MNSQLAHVRRITILGTGLLGGSIGLGLRAAGFQGQIVGISRRVVTLEAAVRKGCIDVGATPEHIPEFLKASQLAIIATPISFFEQVFTDIAACDHDDLIITDVGSTKATVVALANRILPDPRRFVGSHPMAGSEQHGPEAAMAGLCLGKPCIITPVGNTSPEALALVQDLWRTLGMVVTHLSPQDHDRAVAAVSHLPHAVACLLVILARKQGSLTIASTGFRDTTRVASGDPAVWLDIFMSNREAQIALIDAFVDELLSFREHLVGADQAALLKLLTESKHSRDEWIRRKSEAAPELPQ